MNSDSLIKEAFRLSLVQERALKKLGISSLRDLLYHFPTRYTDPSAYKKIAELKRGEGVMVSGTLSQLKTTKAFRKKIPMAEGILRDDSGRIKVIWFHQAYLAKMLEEGSLVLVEGRVSERKGVLYISNPKVSPAPTLFRSGGSPLSPIYKESRGITSNWIFHKIQNLFESKILDELDDPIPQEILDKYHLPSLKNSLIYIHTPKKKEHAEVARKRFAFEEIFFIQLERQKLRNELKKENSFRIEKNFEDMKDFIHRFPFKITNAQKKAIKHILEDFGRGHPMSRLLEGDVGSGKTAVAATVAYALATTKPKNQSFGTLQTAYMAPTEILAQQHFESFIKYFKHLPIDIALITGSGCKKFPSKVNPDNSTDISRSQLLKWVSSGEIAILVGTHALIQKSVRFKNLALAIIDEQHRFGVNHRRELAQKHDPETGEVPHLLSMTATPIPRTLALTIYGDLDLTLLDEMPRGRKEVVTKIVPQNMREEAYEKARQELKNGRQMYVICPRINLPDPDKELAMQTKSVKAEAERLKKEVFPEYEIGILHSKMRPAEKESVMLDFKDKKIDILVATSVVEVGVSVENATVIIIEGAERFGLSQLHQLRGRVLRSTHEPYCFVFADTKSFKTQERLKALINARNGFELAELDLKQRGPGSLVGAKQWGISDLGMEAIKNIKMVEAARLEAERLIKNDPALIKHPLIKSRLSTNSSKIHFE